MPSLASCVILTDLAVLSLQINHETREVRQVSLIHAAAKKHGPDCKCEACASHYMQRTRDKRMKAMMPGNVDMGNRQPAVKEKLKAKIQKGHNIKQVPSPKGKVDKLKPSQLMHERGMILKGKK